MIFFGHFNRRLLLFLGRQPAEFCGWHGGLLNWAETWRERSALPPGLGLVHHNKTDGLYWNNLEQNFLSFLGIANSMRLQAVRGQLEWWPMIHAEIFSLHLLSSGRGAPFWCKSHPHLESRLGGSSGQIRGNVGTKHMHGSWSNCSHVFSMGY
jgi:hypothetical protein